MTADEALELVENVLDYERLNKVQELVFRESWEGRSYIEIARSSGYEADYIKDAGAKLWKLLSKAFGEKVKKDNLKSALKRYLRRTQVNVQRNLTIEVNLSGANLSGANLSGARLFANLNEADLGQANLQKVIMPDDNTELAEEGHNQGIQFNSEDKIHYWNGLRFRSDEEVKIAEALERANVLFFPNSKVRLTTTEGRQNQEPDFLIFHQGKWGILEVLHQDTAAYEERSRLFKSHGICIVEHYDANRCSEEPDRVVQEFLEILSQA
ncbi:pentapeptide repeat-containing protein [Microcoleus sp. FACHB-831]|uniref:pentapeptide repeat-containing protein n=1 Tax=Microcoleus sp. FACHB-831 TaxID=2692827 RepID=UPI001685F27B|nr:pentapeptide repeat-containing protein [Microcoleus sp. FACHB-831]MBD1921290.1 pentapeptide repeat-containing protein [Microcoleus sp. FACHB-831]